MNSSTMSNSASGAGTTTTSQSSLSLEEPVSLQHARTHYRDLHALLAQLSSKLTDVSLQVDRDFLSSYRVHILSVQAEIKRLKQDVAKGEQMLNSDATVAKLENEAKWFSDECVRLRSHRAAMEKDCHQMRERLQAMSQQKVFLCDQLKALMKRNKVLEAELAPKNAPLDLSSLPRSQRTVRSEKSASKQTTGRGSRHPLLRVRESTAAEENMLRQLEQYEREFEERDRQRQRDALDNEEEEEEDFGFDFEHAYEEEEDLLRADDALFRTLSASPPLSAGTQHRLSQTRAHTRSRSPSPPRSSSPGLRKHHTEPLLVLRGREREREKERDRGTQDDDEMSDRARARLSERERAREREKEEEFVRSLSPSQRRLRLASEDALLDKLVHSGKLGTSSFLPPLRVGSSQSAQRQPSSGPGLSSTRHAKTTPHLELQPKRSAKQLAKQIDEDKSPLAAHLESAIREIYQEIHARKTNALALSSSRKLTPAASLTGALQSDRLTSKKKSYDVLPEHRVVPPPLVKQCGSLSGLGIDQFTDNDRFAAMVKFLSKPDVFELVVSKLSERYL